MKTYPKTKLQTQLARLNACEGGRLRVGAQTIDQAFQRATAANDLMWLAAKIVAEKRTLVFGLEGWARLHGFNENTRAICGALVPGGRTHDQSLIAAMLYELPLYRVKYWLRPIVAAWAKDHKLPRRSTGKAWK